ncbi:hypothetical protein F2Q70_00016407 [Brassica cretica]|uniref:Uncharacterized protein n=1 Tax=Brassica cretica TaxID=69181 RepID=A0A8S9I0B4_BRACR|nr:hypothetical protein F2Q70_00016407 [Brassica cretica]
MQGGSSNLSRAEILSDPWISSSSLLSNGGNQYLDPLMTSSWSGAAGKFIGSLAGLDGRVLELCVLCPADIAVMRGSFPVKRSSPFFHVISIPSSISFSGNVRS